MQNPPHQIDCNRIAEYNEATGALIREYVWLNGEALAVIEGGVINFVRVDHIGRPVFASNTAATKTWTATYLPFGEVGTTTGTPIALRFPGQWFQSESGLHQNWMRDYDPTTGRYRQADPLGLVDGASVYGYVKGNPGRWVDRRGEQGIPFGADPNGRVPGGPWTFLPDPGNGRGGTWQNGKGATATWDQATGQHWDVDDGKGGPRQRYNRRGTPLSKEEAHGPYRGPKRFPFRTPLLLWFEWNNDFLFGCGRLGASPDCFQAKFERVEPDCSGKENSGPV